MPQDQVYQLREGWYALVSGRTFGPWPLKEYAQAGLETEQRRAQAGEPGAGQRARPVPHRHVWETDPTSGGLIDRCTVPGCNAERA
jgi:hypothetical protein